jgi:hypothetical protein
VSRPGDLQAHAVAVAVIQENGRIKVEWLMRRYTRLSSLPLLAASLFFGFAAAEIAQQDLFGGGSVCDDWLSFVLCAVYALCLGLPGLALATLRYFVELDQIMQQVIVTRQFGPVRFSSLRRLADFKWLTFTDDGDERARSRMYNVNLCGGRGTTPIQFTSFGKREQADSFARGAIDRAQAAGKRFRRHRARPGRELDWQHAGIFEPERLR